MAFKKQPYLYEKIILKDALGNNQKTTEEKPVPDLVCPTSNKLHTRHKKTQLKPYHQTIERF